MYLFMVVLVLRCFMQAFSSCDKRGLLFVVVRGLIIIAVASLVERRLQGTWTSVVAA